MKLNNIDKLKIMNDKSYYRVLNDLSTEEYDSFDSCIKPETKYIVESWIERQHTSHSGAKYDIEEYKFYNPLGEEILPQFGEWKIKELSRSDYLGTEKRLNILSRNIISVGMGGGNKWKSWGSAKSVKISDKNGLIKSVVIFGVTDLLGYFKKLTKCSYWGEFELSMSNDLLVKENENLKAKIKNLQKEIDRLNEELGKEK